MSENPAGSHPGTGDHGATQPSGPYGLPGQGHGGGYGGGYGASGQDHSPQSSPYGQAGSPYGQTGGQGQAGPYDPYGAPHAKDPYGSHAPYGAPGPGTPYGGYDPYGASYGAQYGAPYGAPAPYGAYGHRGPRPGSDDTTMAMLCHLLGLLTGFLGPLVIYLVKKDQSPYVRDQAGEALNFQLTLLIAYVVAWVLAFALIGFLLLPLIWIGSLVFMVIAAVAANRGENHRYPMTIRFVS
ncbi:DUF4870 domain-containing protein [Planomonospora corallina]|uniref:DUF4870 domain-containing protein n=1 Tax=Planomonospora corallina TaxID=1806052 RepID=A0ABV8I628_9ACTN